MHTIKALLMLGVGLLVTACAFMAPEMTAKRSAQVYVLPLFAAVQSFHQEQGRYPKDQAELTQSPYGQDLVWGKAGSVLMVTYELVDSNTYKVRYDNGTCYTRYINAALTHARCNVFK